MAIAIVKRRIPWSMRSRMQMLGSARAAYYGYISRTSDQRPIVTAHLKVDRAVHQTAPRRSVGIGVYIPGDLNVPTITGVRLRYLYYGSVDGPF